MSLEKEFEELRKLANSEGMTVAEYLKREAQKVLETKDKDL